jgi:Flp pilus assembly protein TadD
VLWLTWKQIPTSFVLLIFISHFHLLIGTGQAQIPTLEPKPATANAGHSAQAAGATATPLDPPLAEAKSLLDAGKVADADRVVRQYLETHAHSADAHFLRGYILFREIQAHALTSDSTLESYHEPGTPIPDADFQSAAAKASLAEFTEGAKYRAPSAFDLKIVALDYGLLGDFVDADKWLTRSLQWNPKDSEGWYWLGRTKYNENRFDEAVKSFEEFLRLEPQSVKAEDNLGLSYAGLGQTDAALTAYKTAIAWQSEEALKNPGPFLDLGILLMELNRPEEALPYFQQAVAISPKESRHHEELGKAYSRLDDLQKAQAELETAVSLSPQNPRLHYLLGRVYIKEGSKEKANAEFERSESLKAAQSSPPSPRP